MANDMAKRDLLIELGTEELPPKALPDLSAALTEELVRQLDDAGLAHGAVESFAAPRRLAVGAEPKAVFAARVGKLAKIGVGRSRFRDVQQSAQNSARAAASDHAPSSGIATNALKTGVSDRNGTVRLRGESSTDRMKRTLASAFIVIDATAGGQ